MTTEPEAMLLFTDDAGQAYLLPATVLEQARISDEQLTALREQLSDDVRGNIQDAGCGPAPAALHLGLQAVITNRQLLAGIRVAIDNPEIRPQGLVPCI